MDPHFNALPGTTPVALTEHDEKHGCRWPIGEHPTLYCNAWAEKKMPHQYCSAHMRMSYRGVTSHGNIVIKR